MASTTRPLRAIAPKQLEWSSEVLHQEHFAKHSRDAGGCFKSSFGKHPFTLTGYTDLAVSVVQNHRFYVTARIRSHEERQHPKRDWFFSAQLFCVAVHVKRPLIKTAFHHHLQWGQHGHSDFEHDLSAEGQKEDEFLDWFERCEQQSSSASAVRGCAASHVITEVTKRVCFPTVQ